jgi:DNA-binding transcriptional LysR family regulator
MASPQVFISYARADKAFADRLLDDLVSIGASVWKDDREITPGDYFSSQIEHAISKSDYFFLLLSFNSISSKRAKWELRLAQDLAVDKDKPRIVPVRLDDVEIPLSLYGIQYANFANGYDTGWKDLSKLFPLSDFRSLTLGGGYGTGIYVLKSFIARFREAFPDLPIEQRVDTSGKLIEWIASERTVNNLDAAVVGRIPTGIIKENVECHEIFRDKSVLTVFAGHPLWGVDEISEKEVPSVFMDDTVFVSRPKGSGLYEAAMNYLKPRLGRNDADRLLETFVVYDLDTVRQYVSEGRGISIMPNIIVNQDVLSGKIWPVKLPGDVSRAFYGVWAKNRCRSKIAEEFITLLRVGLT